MSPEIVLGAYVFILAVFVGFEVVSKVPSTLHTPLMSGANAVHGIIVIGAMAVAAEAIGGTAGQVIAFFAVVLGTINVVGGFAVTDRMLQMFGGRRKAPAPDATATRSPGPPAS